MSNGLGIDFEFDQVEQECDWGQTIIYNGKPYPAVVSLPTESRNFEPDGTGFFISRLLTLSVRKSAIGTAVAIGDKLTYEGDQYRIDDLGPADETGMYYLNCTGLTL
jgi:hypothetical protein